MWASAVHRTKWTSSLIQRGGSYGLMSEESKGKQDRAAQLCWEKGVRDSMTRERAQWAEKQELERVETTVPFPLNHNEDKHFRKG